MSLQETNPPSEQKEALLGSFKDSGEEVEASQLPLPSQAHRFHRSPTLAIFSFFILLLATSSIFTATFVNIKHHADRHTFRPLNASDLGNPTDSFSSWIDCGGTPSQARKRGCVFDLMLSTWIPESCYDDEMMNSYLIKGNHTYYYDEDFLRVLPEEKARRGQYDYLWTDGEFHYRHCVYLLDMQLRSYKTGRPVVVGIYALEHTQHCVDMALWHDVGDSKTRLQSSVGKCGFPKS